MARNKSCPLLTLGLGLMLSFASVVVSAVPLNYAESTDFGNTNSSGPTIGPFDVGVNVVSGSVFREASPPTGGLGGGDYGDFWEMDLATGLQIDAVDIVFDNVTAPLRAFVSDNIIGGSGPFSYQAFTQQFVDGTYALTTSPEGLFRTGAYPFPAGHYYFGVIVLATQNGGGADYEWHVTVSRAETVPVPTSVVLFAIGVAGIGYARTRK